MMRLFLLSICVIGIFSCTSNTNKEGLSQADAVKLEQYMVEGQQLYQKLCSNCHQLDGQGLAQLFPPLKGSDYMKAHFNQTLCSMKYGLEGEITVNGIKFNQKMPGISTITNLEIAEISTYIYNSWGNQHGIISVDTVNQIMKQCKQKH